MNVSHTYYIQSYELGTTIILISQRRKLRHRDVKNNPGTLSEAGDRLGPPETHPAVPNRLPAFFIFLTFNESSNILNTW